VNEAKQHQQFILKEIIPITASEYSSIALRPFNSELACQKITQTFNIKPNSWSDGLYKVIKILL
jgi:dTDP-4-dehydrorhamnose reductase